MAKDLLFDASSLIYALKLKQIDILCEGYIQHLTVYEALNAIWKETYLIKSLTFEEAKKLVDLIIETLNYLNILPVKPHELEIFKKAIKLGLTIYDASYIVLAEKSNLTLVTEDRKLAEKAGKTIKTTRLKNLVKT